MLSSEGALGIKLWIVQGHRGACTILVIETVLMTRDDEQLLIIYNNTTLMYVRLSHMKFLPTKTAISYDST